MAISLTPIELNVIIKPVEIDQQTKSGLYTAYDERSLKKMVVKGEVVAIGPGSYKDSGLFVKPEVKIGDIVYFNPHVPSEIELEGEKFLITNCFNLLAIENNDA